MAVGREKVELRIECGGDLGKCEAVDAALIGRQGIGRLRTLLLRALRLMCTLAAEPVRQAMGNTHLLGKYQQKRQQGIGKGAVQSHV